MTVQGARKIVIGKIRSVMAYGCAVWFIHSPGKTLHWSLKREQIHRLEMLQYECLKQVSGALGNTSQRVLEKELHIESVRIFLRRTMLASRAKNLKIVNDSSATKEITKQKKGNVKKFATSSESSEPTESIPAACPCGHARQTVFHLFIECPDLRVARRQLEDKVGKLDFKRLLTAHSGIAADRAITHFNLAQFEFPREDSQFASVNTGALSRSTY
ncbi:hypothetical protein IL306_008845 [Fusarium sp. DS 682]|nr:hypothetical protein IL306_008845 [Fusarium sp. DS 682]